MNKFMINNIRYTYPIVAITLVLLSIKFHYLPLWYNFILVMVFGSMVSQTNINSLKILLTKLILSIIKTVIIFKIMFGIFDIVNLIIVNITTFAISSQYYLEFFIAVFVIFIIACSTIILYLPNDQMINIWNDFVEILSLIRMTLDKITKFTQTGMISIIIISLIFYSNIERD